MEPLPSPFSTSPHPLVRAALKALALASFITLSLGACSDSNTGADDDDDANGSGSSSGGSTSRGDAAAQPKSSLVVNSGYESTDLGSGYRLDDDSMFVVADVSVHNTHESSLAFSFANFRAVVNGFEIVASPASANLRGACPASGFLSADSTASCKVAFHVDAVPSKIALVSVLEALAEPVRFEGELSNFERCERCNTNQCQDLQNSNEHCGACNQSASGQRSCVDGKLECPARWYWCKSEDAPQGECTKPDSRAPEACVNLTIRNQLREPFNDQITGSCDTVCAPGRCAGGYYWPRHNSLSIPLACNEAPPDYSGRLECFCDL